MVQWSAASMLRCVLLVFGVLLSFGCTRKAHDDQGPSLAASAGIAANAAPRSTVPPVAVPASDFADAAPIDGASAYDQAKAYEANGQYWLARLVLEKRALGPDGTPREAMLLARICNAQEDEACVEACSSRVGRKLKFDGGAPRSPAFAEEHKEPDSDAARARDLLLKHRSADARKLLEPKVIDGDASKEEVRLLRTVCREQGDRMCIALCDAKLK